MVSSMRYLLNKRSLENRAPYYNIKEDEDLFALKVSFLMLITAMNNSITVAVYVQSKSKEIYRAIKRVMIL